ncbi:MAG: ArgE/DapE family deacylase [Anaerolineae bacterium]|nr:ArgE/DapE family deacylase [Anaerolineae bacterium]
MLASKLCALVDQVRERVIDFARRLVSTPSLSGHEEGVADLVEEELRSLGCAEVWRDRAGNVLAKIEGGAGRSVLLHSHMDVVAPGESSLWTYPPFSGKIAEGCLWGRGASDDKGSLAAQVYAFGLLSQVEERPAGDVYLAAVVNEETGGLGTISLLREFKPGLAIIGEPSRNILRRGHRGRFEFVVEFIGRSAHASMPERGINPFYALARFLSALRELPMWKGPDFQSTVAPTLLRMAQENANVIPAKLSLHLDWRCAPGESLEHAQALLQRLIDETVEPDGRAEVHVHDRLSRTYTGVEELLHQELSYFYLPEDDPLVVRARQVLQQALGRPVAVDLWPFCTDGGHLYAAGVPCIGFGPGDEALAHVVDEHIELAQLIEAVGGYLALALEIGRE